MIIIRNTKLYTADKTEARFYHKGVYREDGETLLHYQAAYIEALINDRMPTLPYCSDSLDGNAPYESTPSEKEWEMFAKIWRYQEEVSRLGIAHETKNLARRKAIWDKVK